MKTARRFLQLVACVLLESDARGFLPVFLPQKFH